MEDQVHLEELRRPEELGQDRMFYIYDFNESFVRAFESIHYEWERTPPEKEDKAPTLVARTQWFIVRCILINILRHMRKIRRGFLCHHYYYYRTEPIESIYHKFNFVWTQDLKGSVTLDDDNYWITFWMLLDELHDHLHNINMNNEVDDL